MKDDPFPIPPGPEDMPAYRRIPSAYYWWFGSVVLLGITIIWLPSQCTMEGLNLPDRKAEELGSLKKVNQDKGMEFREDGFWYEARLCNDRTVSVSLLMLENCVANERNSDAELGRTVIRLRSGTERELELGTELQWVCDFVSVLEPSCSDTSV